MATPGAMRSSYGRLLQARPTLSTLALGRNQTPSASFSTTAPLCKRRRKARKTNRDMNPARGVSSIYRSGPREPLSMSDMPLPRPVEFKPEVKVDENHGLWGFFPAPGKLLYTPEETEKHGRAWKVEELRKKSWEDLHALWWKCCRERNMIATSQLELERTELGFGRRELENRDEEVRKTMGAIRHALTERHYTWEDAQQVARSDPEIDMNAGEEGQAYNPSAYEEDFEDAESWEEPATSTGAPAAAEEAAKTESKPESKPEKQPV